MSNEDLFRLGADIGSDVSFFLKGTCAVVEGRGEIVFPVPCPSNLAIALLVPDFSVSTAEAYRWYDEAPPAASRTGIPREEIVQAFRNTRLTDWDFFNSFSTVLSSRYKLYVMLETRLREAGALFTGISGSGSSCFGVFTDRSTAHIGLSKIEGRFRFAGIVEPLREMPPVQRG